MTDPIDELTEACAQADIRSQIGGRARRRRVVELCCQHAPTRESVIRLGHAEARRQLKSEVKSALVITFFMAVMWEVLVSVVAALVVAWVFRDGAQARLIERARAGT